MGTNGNTKFPQAALVPFAVQQHIDGVPLRYPLFVHTGMRVDLHRRAQFCVAHD